MRCYLSNGRTFQNSHFLHCNRCKSSAKNQLSNTRNVNTFCLHTKTHTRRIRI